MLIIYIVNLKVINNYGRKIIVPCEHCGKTLDLKKILVTIVVLVEPLVDVNLINML
jgi:hypothetical protein